MYSVSHKGVGRFYGNFDKGRLIFVIFFTAKFRKNVWMALKLTNIFPQVCCYLAKSKRSAKQLYIHSSKNNKLNNGQLLFRFCLFLFFFVSSEH